MAEHMPEVLKQPVLEGASARTHNTTAPPKTGVITGVHGWGASGPGARLLAFLETLLVAL